MSSETANKPGNTTSEWAGSLIAMGVNLVVGIIGATLAQWGVEIDQEILIAAILGNMGIAGSYTLGRSHLKAKAVAQ